MKLLKNAIECTHSKIKVWVLFQVLQELLFCAFSLKYRITLHHHKTFIEVRKFV